MSNRRPLSSFLTPEDKRARRLEHSDRLKAALEHACTPEGMAAFLRSRDANRHLSACNQMLAAFQVDGAYLATLAQWRKSGYRIRRGQESTVFVTAPGFWPKAAFTAEQTDAPLELYDIGRLEPSRDLAAALAGVLRVALERDGWKGAVFTAFAAGIPDCDLEPAADEDCKPLEPAPPIPF